MTFAQIHWLVAALLVAASAASACCLFKRRVILAVSILGVSVVAVLMLARHPI